MLRVATVFSGIGAFEQALRKLDIENEIVFACDTGERYISIDEEAVRAEISNMTYKEKQNHIKKLYDSTGKHNYVKDAYFANYDIDEDRWYDDIRFIDGTAYKGKVDVFVGGSPCQSFSIMGKRAGLDDARGTLFYEYARLIKEMEPKVFIYENVPGMLSHDGGNTWEVIRSVFESLGYKIYSSILNSKDYGIPQDRKRLFVVGFKEVDVEFVFPEKMDLNSTLFDYLQEKVEARHYLAQKGFEFVTNPHHYGRARLNSNVIRTQKANQQYNWNGDFVFEELNHMRHTEEILRRAYVGQWNGKTGVCRQLSYRECMRLMGFSDDYKIVVPNVAAYRQAGNSIVVNVLEAIIKKIEETGVFDE